MPANAAAHPTIDAVAIAKMHRFPAKKSSNRGDQLDIAEPHGFPGNYHPPERSRDRIQLVQRRFLIGDDQAIVTEPQDGSVAGDVHAGAFEDQFIRFPGKDVIPTENFLADLQGHGALARLDCEGLFLFKTVPLFAKREFAEFDNSPQKCRNRRLLRPTKAKSFGDARSFASSAGTERLEADPWQFPRP